MKRVNSRREAGEKLLFFNTDNSAHNISSIRMQLHFMTDFILLGVPMRSPNLISYCYHISQHLILLECIAVKYDVPLLNKSISEIL